MMADDSGAGAPTTTTTTDTGAPAAPVSVSGAPAAASAPADTGTLLGSAPAATGAEPTATAPATWPDDWRTKIAGEDQKELARLQRMGSPADLWKAYRAIEAKLSAGNVKTALPENATAEELTAWRKENGIPEAPEGYVPELGNGLVLGEADKPILDSFRGAALEANMTPGQFNKALNWYYNQVETFKQQEAEADVTFKSQAEDALRSEWGGEYRANVNAVNNLLATWPDGVAERLLAGRTADGKRIGDDPGVVKALALLAREMNPALPHIPAGAGNPMKATADRISEIQSIMQKEPQRYWSDEKMQAEFRDLLSAQERYQGRSAA